MLRLGKCISFNFSDFMDMNMYMEFGFNQYQVKIDMNLKL